MMIEIQYSNGIVTIYGNDFSYEQTIVLNDTQVFLCLNGGQIYLLESDLTSINGVVQTSAQMIADTFNNK